jgi:hypothetical protein
MHSFNALCASTANDVHSLEEPTLFFNCRNSVAFNTSVFAMVRTVLWSMNDKSEFGTLKIRPIFVNDRFLRHRKCPIKYAKFQVLPPCSVVVRYQRFGGLFGLHLHVKMCSNCTYEVKRTNSRKFYKSLIEHLRKFTSYYINNGCLYR